jgi:hypothetical protein
VELKSRRIRHDKYPTALIGLNKVEACNDENKDYYFVYCYDDGVFYIKYDKETFLKFERNYEYRRGDRSDCYNYASKIVYIPVEKLVKLE